MGGFGFIFFIVVIIALIRFAQYVFKPYNPFQDDFSKPERAQELREALRDQLHTFTDKMKEPTPPLPAAKLKPPLSARRQESREEEEKRSPIVAPAAAAPQRQVQSPAPIFSVDPAPAAVVTPPSQTNAPSFNSLAIEEKMNAAGLLLMSGGEELAIPGSEAKGRVVQLKNFKKLAIVPESAPKDWIRNIINSYDYILLADGDNQVVLRSFSGFTQDFLFR